MTGRMGARLACWVSGGHDWWTYRKADGRLWAPPCHRCGKPNRELRWAHKYREVYARAPYGEEWRPNDEA